MRRLEKRRPVSYLAQVRSYAWWAILRCFHDSIFAFNNFYKRCKERNERHTKLARGEWVMIGQDEVNDDPKWIKYSYGEQTLECSYDSVQWNISEKCKIFFQSQSLLATLSQLTLYPPESLKSKSDPTMHSPKRSKKSPLPPSHHRLFLSDWPWIANNSKLHPTQIPSRCYHLLDRGFVRMGEGF